MKFPFFASFIIFCLWLGYELRKGKKKQARTEQDFWEKEAAANNTRRKSLDDLAYIQIPFDHLPMDVLSTDTDVLECHKILQALSEEPIVNFTGISNTDLKLKYGAPNIDLLSCYDQRYTLLARTLQNWASLLYGQGYLQEACVILEFAVETRTDISATYKLLSQIYTETKQPEKIKSLIPVAKSLHSSMASHILKILNAALCENQP